MEFYWMDNIPDGILLPSTSNHHEGQTVTLYNCKMATFVSGAPEKNQTTGKVQKSIVF